MYRKEQGLDWFGLARVLGKDDRVLWCLHQGVPVSAALNRLRPASTAEILAYMRAGQGLDPVRPMAAGAQQGFIDMTGRRRNRDEHDEMMMTNLHRLEEFAYGRLPI